MTPTSWFHNAAVVPHIGRFFLVIRLLYVCDTFLQCCAVDRATAVQAPDEQITEEERRLQFTGPIMECR